VRWKVLSAAGFEPVDLRSGYNGNSLGAYMELRDNRVTFFVRWLARGKHSIGYRLRAEVPGQFSALPAVAAAMYAPELKANSDEIQLKISDYPASNPAPSTISPVFALRRTSLRNLGYNHGWITGRSRPPSARHKVSAPDVRNCKPAAGYRSWKVAGSIRSSS